VDDDHGVDGAADALGDLERVVLAALVQHDGELLAAVARDQVRLAQAQGAQDVADVAQDRVAGRVAVAVVDVLEVV